MNTLLAILLMSAHADPFCAHKFSELEKTERLSSLKSLFGDEKQIRAVNGTKGSYVVIDAINDDLTISFYTSAVFDLYPIHKDGPLQFCDDGKQLRMVGLGRTEDFEIKDGKFEMGGGGAKRTFANGDMPDKLKKLHHYESPAVAAKP